MQETIIKGTGNSRTLASVPNFLTLYPTYEAFAKALMDRELPIDIGPLNSAGLLQKGTDLNKPNLLKDATAALYGLDAAAVPDDVLALIAPDLADAKTRARSVYGTYVGNGDTSTGARIVFPFRPKIFFAVSAMSTTSYFGYGLKNNATTRSDGVEFHYDDSLAAAQRFTMQRTDVSFDSDGFRVVAFGGFNIKGRTYSYFGIGQGGDE